MSKLKRKLAVNGLATIISVVIILMMVAAPVIAAVTANSVNGGSIVDRSIQTIDLALGSVKTGILGKNAVTSAKIKDRQVKTADLAVGAVGTGRIKNQAVTGAKIRDYSVSKEDLKSSSVNSVKIADGSIAARDIADGAVSASKLSKSYALSDHDHDTLQGAKGDTGPQGAKGDTGPQGPQGDIGPAGSDASLPSGIIVAWSGSLGSIPTGWLLCDGSDGTPDLTDKFILGAVTGLGESGGSAFHGHNDTFSTGSVGSHTHTFGSGGSLALNTSAGSTRINGGGGHNHSIYGSVSSGGALPPYYKMAYIIKI